MAAAEIARLREINEKATQGEWTTERPTKDVSGFLCGVAIAAVMGGAKIYGNPLGGQYPANDQRYIATFDPPTTRALLDAAAALEHARKERDEAIRSMSEWARQAGFAKGALEASESAGIIDAWRASSENLTAQRDAAIKERDALTVLLDLRTSDLCAAAAQRDAAQQDAKEARALLARAKHSINEQYTELHARIEAMLEKKI